MDSERQNKALIVGSVEGKFSKLFKKVRDVNLKAGPFDLLLCVGDFFGSNPEPYNELINGSEDLPNVSTYILGRFPQEFRRFHPEVEDFQGGFDIVDGITYLGQSGVLTTSHGLKIAYLNGSYRSDESAQGDKDLDYFTKKDYDNLLTQVSASGLIDIFLTVQWPMNILELSNNKQTMDSDLVKSIQRNSSGIISQICQKIRPRYYFVGGMNVFFEREPYRNHRVLSEQPKNVTRFLSIANVLNSQKFKWIYAFNLVAGSKLSTEEVALQPDNVTENPMWKVAGKRLEEAKNDESQDSSSQEQFFFSMNNKQPAENQRKRKERDDGGNSRNQNNQNNQNNRKNLKIDTNDCWFCLGSAIVDKSLIVSIGEHSYLALAKGGLNESHMLITPIEHIKAFTAIEEDSIRDEINKFKTSLIQYFKTLDMIPVFFERNFRTAHFQINVVGLPSDKAPALKSACEQLFSKFNPKELQPEDDIVEEVEQGERYFFLECPNVYRFLVHINTQEAFFPVQIGRELLAKRELLNCPERMNWKNCSLNKDDAISLTKKIRSQFKPFDFTI